MGRNSMTAGWIQGASSAWTSHSMCRVARSPACSSPLLMILDGGADLASGEVTVKDCSNPLQHLSIRAPTSDDGGLVHYFENRNTPGASTTRRGHGPGQTRVEDNTGDAANRRFRRPVVLSSDRAEPVIPGRTASTVPGNSVSKRSMAWCAAACSTSTRPGKSKSPICMVQLQRDQRCGWRVPLHPGPIQGGVIYHSFTSGFRLGARPGRPGRALPHGVSQNQIGQRSRPTHPGRRPQPARALHAGRALADIRGDEHDVQSPTWAVPVPRWTAVCERLQQTGSDVLIRAEQRDAGAERDAGPSVPSWLRGATFPTTGVRSCSFEYHPRAECCAGGADCPLLGR